MRLAIPMLALLIATPAAAQIGINGTRQAASTGGDIEVRLGPRGRCSRNREANAMAGRAARSVERARIEIDYRRYRYAGGGLTDAEEAALERREERLDRAASSGYRSYGYRYDARRRADGRGRSYRGC